METKTCPCCNTAKQKDLFGLSKQRKDGLNPYCLDCARVKSKQYRELNPNKVKQSALNYSRSERGKKKKLDYKEQNEVKLKELYKKYRQENAEKYRIYGKKYRQANNERIQLTKKQWYIENREHSNTKKRTWVKVTKENNPIYAFKVQVRRNISMSFKFGKKPKKTELILGCTISEFRKYIEQKFQDGMNWENNGRNGWHLDHIIPLATAKTTEEVLRLNHFTNFQPLWEEDNLKKSDKLNYEFI
jgi:hypothetical protein